MDIFGIIYKAIEGLKKAIDGLLKNMDKALKKQDALLFADGSNVTSYRDLQLDILKNVSFEGTTLFMAKPDSTWQFQYGYYDSEDSAGSGLLKSEEYLIKYKDKPIRDFYYTMYDAIDPKDLLAVLSLDCAKGMNFADLFSGYTNLREVRNIKRVEGTRDIHGMFSGCENLVHIDDFVTNDITDMGSTFNGCKKLKKLPKIDTSKVTYFAHTLQQSGVESIPDSWRFHVAEILDNFASKSNLVDAYISAPLLVSADSAFASCEKLKTVSLHCGTPTQGRYIWAYRTFFYCHNLKEVYIDADEYFSSTNSLFEGCSNLEYISWGIKTKIDVTTAFLGCSNLERFECSKEIESSMHFEECPKLSLDSVKNIINMLKTNEQPIRKELRLHPEAYDRLTPEDIAVAVNKGWVVMS